jgi:hypothetical protein
MRVARLRPKRALLRAGTTLPHQARETLFHHFHHHRPVAPLGLADQQMDVFGHNHVPNYGEAISAARLLQDL